MKRWFNSAFLVFPSFPGLRTNEGYGFAVALSLVLHIVMLTVLLVNWSADSSVKITPPMIISAALVELPKTVSKPQPVRKPPKQDVAEKKRKDEAIKQAAEKKRIESQKKAEQKRKELEHQKALSLKQKQEKKEAARELQAQEKRRQEKELNRKEQEARERALAMEQQSLRQSQQLEHDQLEQARYAALIKSLASQYWNRPPSARNNMVAEIRISLSPFGDVLDITMVKPSGNDEFDRSVIQAIRRASPFSELKKLDRRIFDQYFRRITFRFRPEDLVK